VEDPDREVTLLWFKTAKLDPRYESTYIFNQYELAQVQKMFVLQPIFEGITGGAYRMTSSR
jgi:hypothetical protein